MAMKGGAKGAATTVIAFLIIGGVVLGWAKANNINSVTAGIDYLRGKTGEVQTCFGDPDQWVEWNCSNPLDNGGTVPPINTNPGDPGATQPDVSVPPINIQNPNATEIVPEAAAAYLAQLNSLAIADEATVDYNRSEWNHWLGSRCDSVREQVLRDQGSNIVRDSSNCKVESGLWMDPYGKGELTKPSQIDIDHVIPLSYAAKHGANSWDKAQKEVFANDRIHLLAVSLGENREKSDKGPAEWMPDNKEAHCNYSAIFTSTASKYGLSISAKDKIALEAGLKTC